jgi:hypothetical protein
MVVPLMIQNRAFEGAVIRVTPVDNYVSANHSWLIMAESPLMCSIKNGFLCGPSSIGA